MATVPIYGSFKNIYRGQHYTEDGMADPRVWFYLKLGENIEEGTYNLLVFPFGGSEDEVEELDIDPMALWTS